MDETEAGTGIDPVTVKATRKEVKSRPLTDLMATTKRTGPCVQVDVILEPQKTPFKCHVHCDTGAEISIIPETMVHALGIPYLILDFVVKLEMGNFGSELVSMACYLEIHIRGQPIFHPFIVSKTQELTFGQDFLKAHTFGLEYQPGKRDSIRLVANRRRRAILTNTHTMWKNARPDRKHLVNSSYKNVKVIKSPEELHKLIKSSWDNQERDRINISSVETTTVPPNRVASIKVMISRSIANFPLFASTADQNVTGLIVQNQIITPAEGKLLVTNFSERPIKVMEGQLVAKGSPVEWIQNFTLSSAGNKITKCEPDQKLFVSKPLPQHEQAIEYCKSKYRSMIVNDKLRMLSKNKVLHDYPLCFDPRAKVCQKLAKYEDVNLKEMDFVDQSPTLHPNKSPDVDFDTFDFDLFSIDKRLKEHQKLAIKNLIFKHREHFMYNKNELGSVDRSRLPKIEIKTIDEVPVSNPPRRKSPRDRMIIQEMVDEMLEAGIIRPSESDWSSPVVIVSKKDGSKRFCVDYRRVNDRSIKDNYPLPNMADAFDSCAGANYFTTLDLFSGYHLLPMDDNSIHKTAFVSPSGLFEYTVLPFGLKSAPAKFQRTMDQILSKLKWRTCFVYLDDVIVFAKSFKEHEERLDQVMSTLGASGLKLNPKKCNFAYRSLEFLGFIISKDGIAVSSQKIEKVQTMKQPKNVRQLRQFLGLVGHFRKFIKNFASIAKPLYELLKKEKKWEWTPAAECSFHALKRAIVSAPILTLYKEECRHEVHSDASGSGLGAALMQEEDDEDGNPIMKVVAYWSRGLRPAEKNYAATELEMLAVVEALETFRPYLHGKHFTIVTDHQALLSLEKGDLGGGKRSNARLTKWRLLLRDFDFAIRYTKGKLNVVPDALSRMEQEVEEGKEPDEERMFFKPIKFSSYHRSNLLADPVCKGKTIAELQQDDPYCSNMILKFVEAESRTDRNCRKKPAILINFKIESGILYRKWQSEGGVILCCVLPSCLRAKVIRDHHDGDMGVHPGQNRTIAAIRSKYWWPKLKHDVIAYVRSCRHCLLKKPTRHAKPTSKPSKDSFDPKPGLRPMQWVAIDYMVLADHETFYRNKYIVVVTCYMTKFVVIGGLPDQSAETLNDWFFSNIALNFSWPEALVADNAKVFKEGPFDRFCQLARIKKRHSSPYRPQSNGQVERMNGVIKEALSGFVSRSHKNWDQFLKLVAYGINCLVSSVTGMSPFEAVFGYKPRSRFDNMFCLPDLTQSPPATDARVEVWKRLWEKVDKAGEKLKKRKVLNYLPKFNVGDRVAILDHRIRSGVKGFLYLFKGPYEVIKLLIEDSYEVVNCSDPQDVTKVHVSQMKRWYDRDDEPIQYDAEAMDTDPEVFSPDAILAPEFESWLATDEQPHPPPPPDATRRSTQIVTGLENIIGTRSKTREMEKKRKDKQEQRQAAILQQESRSDVTKEKTSTPSGQ